MLQWLKLRTSLDRKQTRTLMLECDDIPREEQPAEEAICVDSQNEIYRIRAVSGFGG